MSTTTLHFDPARLRANVERIQERIADAARRAGRDPQSVLLVAVTKTVDASVASALVDMGIVDLGENRPQELWRKAELLPPSVRWHQIGHLQRNKVKRTLPIVHLVHSVDTVKLAAEIDKHAARLGQPARVLLQVNVSREPQKHGFAPQELKDAVREMASLSHLEVHGLMAMAALVDDPEKARPAFRELAQLLEDLKPHVPRHWPFDQLSMGMSNDFEVAIEEGATIVRVGSALFEGIFGDDGAEGD